MSSLPYPVPPAVKALGEPERIFAPGAQASATNKALAGTLAFVALGCLAIAVMLFYAAVHPFGTSPPPATVCWAVGGGLTLLACVLGFGAYRYFSGAGDNKQTYLVYPQCLVELFRDKHRIIPWNAIGAVKATGPLLKTFRFPTGSNGKNIAFDYSLPNHDELAALITNRSGGRASPAAPARVATPAVTAHVPPAIKTHTAPPAPEAFQTQEAAAPVKEGVKLSMQDALRTQPALQQAMGVVIEALCNAAPEHYAMIHLLVETRKSNGKTAVLFTHGSPVLLNEYSTLVPDSVANASFAVVDWWLRQGENFPGFEAVLRKTAARKWDIDIRRLDERANEFPKLPRYPIRVCGYGLSLAPPPDSLFGWQRNTNPPGIIASMQNNSGSQAPKRVQVIISEAGHQVALGQGVAKAGEVVQVSEGPHADNWTIETPIFHTVWPAALDLRYPLASKTRFDLLGRDGAIAFVQGPLADDPHLLDTMAVEGQAEVARGKTSGGQPWIELAYEMQGAQWRQRHYARRFSPRTCFVVTAQSLQSAAEKIFRASDEVADSLNLPSNQ